MISFTLLTLLFFLVFIKSVLSTTTIPPPVESLITVPNLGKIKGLVQRSPNPPNYAYYQYKAIPYAQNPPRFTISKPVSPWNDTHDGTKEGNICPQVLGDVRYPGAESEDCLVVTVTSPQNPNNIQGDTLAPVLVFIYGGMFVQGNSRTSMYNPEFLVQEDVVVVQPNYRLGALGWMTDGEIIPGNIGLKDVRLALEWVQAYIKFFGGDPQNVTINGESAGSVIVSTLWLSQNLSNLFHRVFMQSGTIINPWSVQKQPERSYEDVLNRTRCRYVGPTRQEQIDCLKSLSFIELNIVNTIDVIMIDVFDIGVLDGLSMAVVVEDPNDPDAIVVQNPLEQLELGVFRKDAALMISLCSEEMFDFSPILEILRRKSNQDLVPYGMMTNDSDKGIVGGMIKSYYAGNEKQWPLTPSSVYTTYASDFLFNFPLRRYVEFIKPKMPDTPIFVLQFSYASEMGRYNDKIDKVGHSDDLIYSWKEEDFTKEDDVKATYPAETFYKRRQFNRMICNFVKYGNPTLGEDLLLENLIWPQVSTADIFEYLNFDHNNTIKSRPKDDNYLFWLNLYKQYGNAKVTL